MYLLPFVLRLQNCYRHFGLAKITKRDGLESVHPIYCSGVTSRLSLSLTTGTLLTTRRLSQLLRFSCLAELSVTVFSEGNKLKNLRMDIEWKKPACKRSIQEPTVQ